jgi:hypothetical protein
MTDLRALLVAAATRFANEIADAIEGARVEKPMANAFLRETSDGDAARSSSSRSELMTTEEAAKYCRYENTAALLKAQQRGYVRHAGRRGPRGPCMWRREDLDAFLTTDAIGAREASPRASQRDERRPRRTRWAVAERAAAEAASRDALERLRRGS